MKYSIIITSLFLSLASSGQITRQNQSKAVELGEIKQGGTFLAGLSYSVTGTDTSYLLIYRNLEYETLNDLQTISFDGSGGVVDTLYNIISGVFDSKEKTVFTLGSQSVSVYYHGKMGMKYVNVWGDRGYFNLTRKQLDKLFGKTRSE